MPFAPFYIFWSPDSSRLAYLSNWLNGSLPSMALRLAELPQALDGSENLVTSTLAQGQPLYFSWSPDGERLLTHTGEERVGISGAGRQAGSNRHTRGSLPGSPMGSKRR